MATNLQTGSGWRFAKDYAADHRVGRIDRPSIPLSQVVAASSAFPPFLSPVRVPLGRHGVAPMPGADLHRPPFTVEAVLTDGGVYDNLGLERVWRRCRTILVSNAGGSTPEIGRPSGRWVGQIFRTLRLIHQQAEDSRKRLLFGVHNLKQRKVAFWSIDTPISAYGVPNAVAFADEATRRAATLRTRLNRFLSFRNRPSSPGRIRRRGRITPGAWHCVEFAAGRPLTPSDRPSDKARCMSPKPHKSFKRSASATRPSLRVLNFHPPLSGDHWDDEDKRGGEIGSFG